MKGERVAQLELILRSHPEGLRRAEIARRIGVHRSTVSRYIEDLQQYIDVYEENNLIKIAEKEADEKLALSVYESLALNMGAEMLVSNSEFRNPHLASGLRKIAMNMQSYAPKICKNILAVADEIDNQAKKKKGTSQYNSILEVLIDSWISGRMVCIVTNKNGTEEETELAPYFIGFIEGDFGRNPITVTGRLRHTTEIITIDISTVKSATILNETYTIPDNLKPFKKPDSLVPYSGIDMIPLEIKFRQKSAFNVFDRLAHNEPVIEKLKDGSLKYKLEVENSIELILRILQCGSNAEILGPAKFREKFISYVKEVLRIYQ